MSNFSRASLQTKTGLGRRRSPFRTRLHRSHCFVLGLGLAASFCMPAVGFSQAPAVDPADVDSGKVQPLDLKPGCWEVRIESLSWVAATPQELKPEEISKMESFMTPEQLTEFKSVVRTLQEGSQKYGKPAQENRQQVLRQPGGGQQMACTDAPFGTNGVEVYGSQTQKCERSVQESGGVRHMHVLCPGPEGAPLFLVDYQRIDEGYFTGTRVGTLENWPTIMSFAGKWMGEASPHLPHSPPPTDLDGKRPLGPVTVMRLDGFRVVAMAQGVQIIAVIAAGAFGGLPANTVKAYGPNLADAYQQIYLHWSVANEAMNMMLGLQEPWKSQLAAQGIQNLTPSSVRFNQWAQGNPFDQAYNTNNLSVQAQEEARERILWDAYFSSAKTDAEKKDMLQKAQEKYKVTIIDPDFFSSQTSP